MLLLYINDLPVNFQGVKLVLSDNTKVFVVWQKWGSASTKKCICYERIGGLVSKKDHIINIKKKAAMFCCSNQFWLSSKPQIVCNNTLITYKPEVRFLGIYITENLKWNFHTCSLCSSLSKVSAEVTKGSFEPIHAKKHLFCIIWMAFETWYNTLGRGKWKLKTFRVKKKELF